MPWFRTNPRHPRSRTNRLHLPSPRSSKDGPSNHIGHLSLVYGRRFYHRRDWPVRDLLQAGPIPHRIQAVQTPYRTKPCTPPTDYGAPALRGAVSGGDVRPTGRSNPNGCSGPPSEDWDARASRAGPVPMGLLRGRNSRSTARDGTEVVMKQSAMLTALVVAGALLGGVVMMLLFPY